LKDATQILPGITSGGAFTGEARKNDEETKIGKEGGSQKSSNLL